MRLHHLGDRRGIGTVADHAKRLGSASLDLGVRIAERHRECSSCIRGTDESKRECGYLPHVRLLVSEQPCERLHRFWQTYAPKSKRGAPTNACLAVVEQENQIRGRPRGQGQRAVLMSPASGRRGLAGPDREGRAGPPGASSTKACPPT